MKIGIICDCLDDGYAGISVYTENLVKHILEQDKENEYVLIHHSENDNPIFQMTEELIIPIPKFKFGRELRKIFYLPKMLDAEGFDLIHETSQVGPFFRKTNFKQVVTIHDLSPIIIPETHTRMLYLQHKFGLPIILKNVDKVIAVSESTKSDLMEHYNLDPSGIQVIYEGSRDLGNEDIPTFLEDKGITQPYYLYVGTLEPRKDVNKIIRAFEKFSFSNPEHKLVIVGKKGWGSNLYTSNTNVIFTGYVKNKFLPTLYKRAEAFIFPSKYEGFGLPVLEAMNYGCPVITSNNSSLPEIVGDSGILLEPTVPNLVHAMEDIKHSWEFPEMRERIVQDQYEQAKKFSWEKAAKETIEVYKNVINGTC